ncbi:unnamed protein product [Camellia sinensis]
MRGVTGLRTRDGKSRILGDKISGFRGENSDPWTNPGTKGLILKFLRLFLRSYSLEEGCFLGPVLMGGIGFFGGSDLLAAASLAVSEDPVSIWTTCLKEEVSAWTKVVGYGLLGSDLVMGGLGGVGVGGGGSDGGWWWWSPLLLLLLLLLLVVLVLWLFGDLIRDGF